MFEFIRTHQRLMQFLLLIFVAPFLFAGSSFLSSLGSSDLAVAKVGNKTISQSDLESALQAEGPRVAMIPDAKKLILDRMIGEMAMNIEATKDHIYPADQEIATTLATIIPELADPKLTKEQRRELLASFAARQRISPAALNAKVLSFMVGQRLAGQISSTAIVPDSVAATLSNYMEQQREVQQLPFKNVDFTAQVKPTDDMLKTYYTKNIALYQNPEQTKIEYVVLSVDAIAKQIDVPDSDVAEFYKANQKLYTVEEQRRASHILIASKDKDSDAVKAAAKAKAEKLLAEVRKNPGDFAKLAKENSDDPGSGERGGDLDYFGPTAMVKPFEDAAQKLKVGEISDLVKSDFGYHIILLTGIKPAEIKPLEAVKEEILAAKRKELAIKKFGDLREIFKNAVFEQTDSLKPAVDKLADKVKLTIESASVSRKPDPNVAATAPYNNPKFLEAIYSDDVLNGKHYNTKDIDVGDRVVIAGRVTQYQAASQKPFEEVQSLVREAVTQVEAHNLAQKAAAAKLAALQAKDDTAGFDTAKVISRKDPAGIEASVWQTLTKADASKLPALVQVEVPGQGYSVFRINKVIPPAKPDPAVKTQVLQQVANFEAHTYVEALKKKADAKILRPSYVNAPMQALQPGAVQPDMGDN